MLPVDTAVEQMIASCADRFKKDKETRGRKSTTATVCSHIWKLVFLGELITTVIGFVQHPRGHLNTGEWMIWAGHKLPALGGPAWSWWWDGRDSRSVPRAVFQVRLMITDAARHKLLVLTGQCFENTGELILQSGSFSFQNFIEIFTDQEVGSCLGD